jgi:hypothetical protein
MSVQAFGYRSSCGTPVVVPPAPDRSMMSKQRTINVVVVVVGSVALFGFCQCDLEPVPRDRLKHLARPGTGVLREAENGGPCAHWRLAS